MLTRIIIADENELFRKGIESALQSHKEISILGEAADGGGLLKLLPLAKPDIVLLDLKLPVVNGYEVLEKIQQEKWPVKPIVISAQEDESNIKQAVEAGARGFLSKNAHPHEIAEAIYRVASNGFYFNDLLSKAGLHRLSLHERVVNAATGNTVAFSVRELEVLKLLSDELTSREIGKILHAGTRTIEGMRHNMIKKAGAKNIIGLNKQPRSKLSRY